MRFTPPGRIPGYLKQIADTLLTVKSNQKNLYRQISAQFQRKHHIPFAEAITRNATAEKRPGSYQLRRPRSTSRRTGRTAWIVEVITTNVKARGQRMVRPHLFLKSIRTTPDALLRVIRQCWSI